MADLSIVESQPLPPPGGLSIVESKPLQGEPQPGPVARGVSAAGGALADNVKGLFEIATGYGEAQRLKEAIQSRDPMAAARAGSAILGGPAARMSQGLVDTVGDAVKAAVTGDFGGAYDKVVTLVMPHFEQATQLAKDGKVAEAVGALSGDVLTAAALKGIAKGAPAAGEAISRIPEGMANHPVLTQSLGAAAGATAGHMTGIPGGEIIGAYAGRKMAPAALDWLKSKPVEAPPLPVNPANITATAPVSSAPMPPPLGPTPPAGLGVPLPPSLPVEVPRNWTGNAPVSATPPTGPVPVGFGMPLPQSIGALMEASPKELDTIAKSLGGKKFENLSTGQQSTVMKIAEKLNPPKQAEAVSTASPVTTTQVPVKPSPAPAPPESKLDTMLGDLREKYGLPRKTVTDASLMKRWDEGSAAPVVDSALRKQQATGEVANPILQALSEIQKTGSGKAAAAARQLADELKAPESSKSAEPASIGELMQSPSDALKAVLQDPKKLKAALALYNEMQR